MTRGPTISSAEDLPAVVHDSEVGRLGHPAAAERWRMGTHGIGRNLVVGVRCHRVRWLACARAS
jgi:hypothetical protein